MNENDVITRNRCQTTADVVYCTIEFEFVESTENFVQQDDQSYVISNLLLICRGTEGGHFFGRKRRNYL